MRFHGDRQLRSVQVALTLDVPCAVWGLAMSCRSALTPAPHMPCALCLKQPNAANSSTSGSTSPNIQHARATRPALLLLLRAVGGGTWAPQQQQEGAAGSVGVLLLGLLCRSWLTWSRGWPRGGTASALDTPPGGRARLLGGGW
jgi:hypothetical protein